MRIAAGLAALTLLAATPAVAQDKLRELNTDRPDKTESAFTVDAGHFQLEADIATYTFDIDRDANLRVSSLNVAPINLKYGITRSTDIQLIVEPFGQRIETDRTTGVRQRFAGFGDVTLRLKHNLWGNDGGKTAFALMPFVKLPTNTGGLGNKSVEFGIIAPFAADLGGGVNLGAMTELDMIEASSGKGLTPSIVNSATLEFDVTKRFGFYTELFTEKPLERAARWAVTVDMGMTYELDDNLRFDAGVDLGVTRAADDVMLFVGLSRRF